MIHSPFRPNRTVILAAAMFAAFAGTQCSAPRYREVRRPAPGGGFYVQRIPIAPGDQTAAPRGGGRAGLGLKPQEQARGDRPGFRFPWFGGRSKGHSQSKPADDGSFWIGGSMTGKPSMRISLGEQRVYFYKGGELAGAAPISSGRESHATRPGKFSVIQKDKDHDSSLYGDYVDQAGEVVKADVDVRKDPRPPGTRFDGADMRYFMRITGAIGMHEGYLPGYPASHGCIRLPGRMAEIFFNEAPLGTPVEIVP